MIKAIIIDDEKNARDLIESIINKKFSEIKILSKASSVVEGIKAIIKEKPDIVFLDIEMKDGTGFDVLDSLTDRKFNLIFITAYNQHALKAFKYSATDYLMKPIDIEEFVISVTKALNSKLSKNNNNYNVLKQNLSSKTLVKIAIPTLLGFEYINISEIIRFEADGRYSNIYLKDGCKFTVSKALGEFNDLTEANNFFKSHKSHLINLIHVKRFIKKDGGVIIMEDGSQVTLARSNRDEFIKKMSGLSS